MGNPLCLARRRRPTQPAQVSALDELLCGPLAMEAFDAESFGECAHERARLTSSYVHPRRLFPSNDVDLERVPGLRVVAVAVGLERKRGRVLWRHHRDPRHLGFVLAHELAHEVLRIAGHRHTHADVQRVALTIMLPRSAVMPVLRRLGARAAISELVRRHRYCPAWAIVWRVREIAAVLSQVAA